MLTIAYPLRQRDHQAPTPRDRKAAAWYEKTARAFEESGRVDLAIDWAKQATDLIMAISAYGPPLLVRMLAEHHPHESLDARLWIFRRSCLLNVLPPLTDAG